MKVAANVHQVDIDPARRLPQPGCSCKLRPSDHPSPSTFEHREKGRFPIAQPNGFAATGSRRTFRSTCGRRRPGFTHEQNASSGLFLRGCGCVSAALRRGWDACAERGARRCRRDAYTDSRAWRPRSYAVARGRIRRRTHDLSRDEGQPLESSCESQRRPITPTVRPPSGRSTRATRINAEPVLCRSFALSTEENGTFRHLQWCLR